MKFLIDMPLSPALAIWLCNHGHDAIHAGEVGLHRASDAELIVLARQDRRTIVTADLDYPRMLAQSRGKDPSIILFRDGNWSDADIISRMSDVLLALPENEIQMSFVTVDRKRIRRRRLPLQS